MKKQFSFAIFAVLFYVLFNSACNHDPFFTEMDGSLINPIDTIAGGGSMSGTTCDPDTLYFEKDILPILMGNCAYSGCHDVTSATEGVILNNFQNVISTAEVMPFDLQESDLYERITEDKEDKRMPPPPNPPLSQTQINKIANWILQGAQNLSCEEDTGECETTDIMYSTFVAPLLQTRCIGCHNASTASGGIILEGYDNVKSIAVSGRLYGAVGWLSGYVPMPQNQAQLAQCDIDKLKSWIDAGAQNN